MKQIRKILFFIGDNPYTVAIVMAITIFLMWAACPENGTDKITNEEKHQSSILPDKYYIREVRYDSEDPFEVTQIDTIIILDQKKGFVKWSFIHSNRFDSTFFISTKYEYLIERIKPLKNN